MTGASERRSAGALAGASSNPAFLVTIDTEGDNLWAAPVEVTTENARCLPRFQALCERHGFKPTYLTDHEMALCDRFVEFARDGLGRGRLEIGMHLHAWSSPPLAPLTEDDSRYGPYLIEYPEAVMREKVRRLSGLLEDTLGRPVRSHRAGRWAFNETYAKILAGHGYAADSSVTPHVSWRACLGDPKGCGGTDYRGFPELPYFLDLDDIRRPGGSRLVEVPVTIMTGTRGAEAVRRRLPVRSLPARAWNRLCPAIRWLRPDGRNLRRMLAVLRRLQAERRPCAVFMLHSSELMPGGSPTFPTERSVEELYGHLEVLFARAARSFQGLGLGEFAGAWAEEHQPPTPSSAG